MNNLPDGAPIQDNLAVIHHFTEILLKQLKVREAFETLIVEDYVQHSPMVPDGRAAAIKRLEAMFANMPGINFEIARILVDGELATVHSLLKTSPDDRGVAVVDLFRIKDGNIAEHWDVIQLVPEHSANANIVV